MGPPLQEVPLNSHRVVQSFGSSVMVSMVTAPMAVLSASSICHHGFSRTASFTQVGVGRHTSGFFQILIQLMPSHRKFFGLLWLEKVSLTSNTSTSRVKMPR